MYWRRIIQGLVLFLIFWILLPSLIVSIGVLINPGGFPETLKLFGKLIGLFGFAFGMISASYLILDGGGGPMFCCPPKKLVRCGTYSMCRHPIYLGFILYIVGLSLAFGSRGSLITSVVFSILVVMYAFLEEKKLVERFPDYKNYKKEVPAFIPRKPTRDETCPPLLFMLLFYVGHVISWFTWRIEVEKRCEVPEGGYVILANHVTYLDFAVVVYAISRFVNFPVSHFHYVRHEWLYKNVGCFPIKRHVPDVKAIRKIMEIVKKGGRVGIFPEAERSWDGRFLGFKRGFEKLLEKLSKPMIGLRIEKAHLRFPRWGKIFYPGRVKVIVDCFDDPKSVERFLSKPSVSENDVYNSYRGVEKYVYMCPKCGGFGTIKSFKKGLECSKCGFKMVKPTVGDLWRIHDDIVKMLKLPYEEKGVLVDLKTGRFGDEVLVRMTEDRIEYDGKTIKREDVVSFIVEGRTEIFIYDGEDIHGFKFESALLWNDLLKRFWKL